MPLTGTTIRHAKAYSRARKLFDGGGLYLEVSPNGGKWWRLKYRFTGKEKRLSLGVYPDVSLKEARRRRDEARQLLPETSTRALTERLRRNRNAKGRKTVSKL